MRDADKFAEDLLDLLENMILLLEMENEVLETSAMDVIEPLVDKKTSMFETYGKKLEYLRRFSEVREAISDDLREELLTLNEEFQILAEKNQALLKVAIEAGQQLFDSLSKAAMDNRSVLARYSKDGSANKGGDKPVALAYNQEL